MLLTFLNFINTSIFYSIKLKYVKNWFKKDLKVLTSIIIVHEVLLLLSKVTSK